MWFIDGSNLYLFTAILCSAIIFLYISTLIYAGIQRAIKSHKTKIIAKRTWELQEKQKQLDFKNEDEKVRVCYLINQLSEKVDKVTRIEWIGAMLRTTGIEQDYYRSKYREPISDPPSKKNKEFADALKEILS